MSLTEQRPSDELNRVLLDQSNQPITDQNNQILPAQSDPTLPDQNNPRSSDQNNEAKELLNRSVSLLFILVTTWVIWIFYLQNRK